MIHPLLRLAATQPQLLADHAEAYAGLLGEELTTAAQAWRRRLALSAAALGLGLAAAVLAGVALMLWAVTPDANLQAPWALIVAPGAAALLATGSALAAGRKTEGGFANLKQQLRADLVMLREVTTP